MGTLRRSLLVSILSLSACALKDPPTTADLAKESLPNLTLPAQWKQSNGAGPVQDNWIAALGDPQLPPLVDEAMRNNPDMRVAASRVDLAAAGVKAAGGQALPAVDLLARTSGKLGGDNSGLGGWLVSASWEVDVWGRVRYGKRAADDQYASTVSDAAAAAQSLAALVAKAWFLAIEAGQQRQLALDMIASSERLVGIATDRERIGSGSALEISQARASLQTLRDVERQLDLAQQQALRSLELLLGRYPAAEIKAASGFPPLSPRVPTGVPAELLERRPDVVAAQRRVAAAFSRVGEAQMARLPRIALTAGISSYTSDVFVLQDRDNPIVGFGANLLWPLFRGGALEAQSEARIAEQKQAAAVWAQTGLRAFNEVESALASATILEQRVPLLEAQVAENQKVLDLENVRFRVGSRDLQSVVSQQLVLYGARTNLLRVRAEQYVQRVNLHVAVGGGFGSAPAANSASSILVPPEPAPSPFQTLWQTR